MNSQKGLLALGVVVIVILTMFGTYFYTKNSLQVAPLQATSTSSTVEQTAATTTATTSAAIETAPWRGQVRAQFNGLGDWKEEVVNNWRLVGTLDPSLFAKYPAGRITILTQSFDADRFGTVESGSLERAGAAEDVFIASVRKTLIANGWTLTASPNEGGPYLDYLYVKNGHPLVFTTGHRNAVVGGMYVAVQYLE